MYILLRNILDDLFGRIFQKLGVSKQLFDIFQRRGIIMSVAHTLVGDDFIFLILPFPIYSFIFPQIAIANCNS